MTCRGAIPAKENLKRRKILVADTYDHCNEALESVTHTLWECPELTQIWNATLLVKP